MNDTPKSGGFAPKYSYLLMLGHLWADACQGAMTATLPFLVLINGFSYVDVTILIFAQNITSAIIQPLFGWLGDKKARPWLLGCGVLLAGLGITGVGLLNDFVLIACSAMVTGVGVAMFHPEGGRLANLVAEGDKSQSMSVFAVGGNIGFIFGPMIAAAFLVAFGLPGTTFFLFPALAIAGVLFAFTNRFRAYGLVDSKAVEAAGGKEHWGKFSLVMGALSVNSIVKNAMSAFVPMFMISILGMSEGFGSSMLSVMAVAGAVGTVLSGMASKKFGTHMLMLVGFSIMAVGLLLFAIVPNVGVCVAILGAVSFFSSIYYPSSVTLGQSFIPQHLGMASGLTYGVTISLGGLVSPLFGWIGDSFGLQPVMEVAAVFSLVGVGIALVIWRVASVRKRKESQRLEDPEIL